MSSRTLGIGVAHNDGLETSDSGQSENPSETSDGAKPLDERAKHFFRWLRHLSGCHFVAGLINEQRINCFIIDSNDRHALADFEKYLDDCTKAKIAAVGIFPSLKSEVELSEFIHKFTKSGRWEIKYFDGPSNLQVVSINWKTEEGKLSSAMGFAPLMSMPVTRRAPYVGLAVWPGPQKPNSKPTNAVGFIDIPLDLSTVQYQSSMESTKEKVKMLLGEDPKHWRKVAFALPKPTA
jgi:hypothetical protein